MTIPRQREIAELLERLSVEYGFPGCYVPLWKAVLADDLNTVNHIARERLKVHYTDAIELQNAYAVARITERVAAFEGIKRKGEVPKLPTIKPITTVLLPAPKPRTP